MNLIHKICQVKTGFIFQNRNMIEHVPETVLTWSVSRSPWARGTGVCWLRDVRRSPGSAWEHPCCSLSSPRSCSTCLHPSSQTHWCQCSSGKEKRHNMFNLKLTDVNVRLAKKKSTMYLLCILKIDTICLTPIANYIFVLRYH